MGIVRQFLRDCGYVHRSDIPRGQRRAYAAASMNRLSGDWLTTATSIDNDIRSGMSAVRSRARDLSQNSEFAKAYLRAVRKNVVGSEGFALQVKAVNYENSKAVSDRVANSKLEDAFYDWGKPDTATVTGKILPEGARGTHRDRSPGRRGIRAAHPGKKRQSVRVLPATDRARLDRREAQHRA